MSVSVCSQFDGGNIELLSARDPADIHLRIVTDKDSEFLQWFYFSVAGVAGTDCGFTIDNAGQTSYPRGWEDYDVVYSSDQRNWYRTPSQFDGQCLSWSMTPAADTLWFAYFAPYSLDQQAQLLADIALHDGVHCESLCSTLDGRSLPYLRVDTHPDDQAAGNAQSIWVIARQHPGETMASWWMQGFLQRLCDADDATARALRRLASIHIVPNMNPDGSYRGHLRTNAAGVNLNREWAAPSPDKSPEVYHVRKQMDKTGVDLSLDVHGDEVLPYNFIAGTEGVVSWDALRESRLIDFKHTVASLNPDFQTRHGYPRTRPSSGNMSICSNQLAERFACLAMTLEMPFKDTADTPRPAVGWSPARCQKLGASFVDAVYLCITDRLLKSSLEETS